MDNSLPQSTSQKPISEEADQAACTFAVIGGMLSGAAIKFWPDHTTVDDSVGIWPIFWIFAGAGLGILGFVGVMAPALVLLLRAQTRLRLGLIAVGLAITSIGVVTLTKWQAVPTLDHGP
jgi:hypothetical protein